MIDYSEKFLDLLVPIFRPILANGRDPYYLIQAHPNFVAPSDPYAVIDVANVQDVGTLETGDIDENGMQVKQHQDVTLIIDTFGKGAYTAATKLARYMEYPSMTQALSNVGVCFRDNTQVRNFTELIQAGYEERAQFEITLGTADGNFASCYNPANEGLPSQPTYDEGITPIENVCVNIAVAPTGDAADGTLDLGTTKINSQ
ncbi:MAG: hypothetical protein HRU21_09315 [Pseudomonadales bacterium]|nr:hypothetical protein [Pseudomonadales bacterium]